MFWMFFWGTPGLAGRRALQLFLCIASGRVEHFDGWMWRPGGGKLVESLQQGPEEKLWFNQIQHIYNMINNTIYSVYIYTVYVYIYMLYYMCMITYKHIYIYHCIYDYIYDYIQHTVFWFNIWLYTYIILYIYIVILFLSLYIHIHIYMYIRKLHQSIKPKELSNLRWSKTCIESLGWPGKVGRKPKG